MTATSNRTHQCTVCGTQGPWGPTWSWYGSIKEIDDGAPIVKTCSDQCKAEAIRQGLVATVKGKGRAAEATATVKPPHRESPSPARDKALAVLDRWLKSMDNPETEPPLEVHHRDLALIRAALTGKEQTDADTV